jgi:L-lysine exporter family protein LysE/ArgO
MPYFNVVIETFLLVPLGSGFLAGASLIIAIGAQNAFVLRQGLRREHVLPIVLVCALSDVALIAAGVAGVGAVVTAAPIALAIIRWAGAAFLLGYAALAIRRVVRPQALIIEPNHQATTSIGEKKSTTATRTTTGLSAALATALALTWLNPHVYLDTVVLLGSLAASQGTEAKWIFATGAGAASILWFTALGYGSRYLGRLFSRPLAWRVLDGTIALVMIVLAAKLML